MEKKNKHLFFWIAFPIGWTLISLLLIFYFDLANGPLIWFILELLLLVAFFVVRVLFRDKKKWVRLVTWAAFLATTIAIIGFDKTAYIRKSAAYYKNPELITELLQLNQGKVQGFYNEDRCRSR